MSDDSNAYSPLQGAKDYGNHTAEVMALVRSMIVGGVRTSLPVEVMSVTNDGGVAPIGFVSIKPLVAQVDGDGKLIPHGIINNVPYLRIQGGQNAVILDPQVGDIGMASFCDRDISSVKSNQRESTPGSSRKFNMSDAIYHSSILSSTIPDQYVQFSQSGLTVRSPLKVRLSAPEVEINGDTTFTDDVTFNAGMTNQGKDVSKDHMHGGVSTGSGSTGIVK